VRADVNTKYRREKERKRKRKRKRRGKFNERLW
jgi:hypothetical protein